MNDTETIARARELFAASLSQVDGVNVRSRGPIRGPKPGDGWVTVGRADVADHVRASVALVAVVVCGQDEAATEDLIDAWMVPLLDAAAAVDGLPTADVVVQPIVLPVDQGGSLNGLTVSITTEVTSG
jgi:hypothetical protein